jgi:hypothetical protein
VEWFNAVDATYRSELKELNELNFQRFDARLEQRLAQLESRLAQMESRLEKSMLRWMFTFWAPTALALIALLLRS